MTMNDFFIKINDIDYPVHITYKRIKNIHYRFKENAFLISCHPLTPKRSLINGLNKFAPSLLKRSVKPSPIGEDYIYLYGNKISISTSGVIHFNNGETVEYNSREELIKKLKRQFGEIVNSRAKYYTQLMGVEPYKFSIRNMTTRYGSNSKKTKSIRISSILMHYSLEIIDSVIVHELAHIKVFDHSKKFYEVVYKYCPNYDICRKKLVKGEFQ